MVAQPRTARAGISRPAGTCPVCGLALWWPGADGICPNRWCRRPDREFSTVYPLGVHTGALRQALVRYKYHSEWSWADAFAGLVARYLQANFTWFEEFDLITGVPSFTGAGARRAWDPVGEILERLTARVDRDWTVDRSLVVKIRETPPMQGMDWAARQTLAKSVLRASLAVPGPVGQVVDGARLLVLDDVMTEGSTMREVARVLRRAGAEEVAGLVLARPRWSPRRETQGPIGPS